MTKPQKPPQAPKTGAKTGHRAGVMVSPLTGAECPTGAHPGNTGGKPGRSGRPPSIVREACRQAFDQRIPLLEKIADGMVPFANGCPKCGHQDESGAEVPSTDNRLRALDALGRYGLGEQRDVMEIESVRSKLAEQRELIRSMLPGEMATRLLNRLRDEVWV